jgi:hypothetical protein
MKDSSVAKTGNDRPGWFKTYAATIIWSTLLVAFGFMYGSGFLLFLGLLFVIPLLLQNIYWLIRGQHEGRTILIKSVIWILATGSIYACQIHLARNSEAAVAEIIAKVESYHESHRAYPDPDDAAIQEYSAYPLVYIGATQDRGPILVHPSTWMLFSRQVYDFDNRTWTHVD